MNVPSNSDAIFKTIKTKSNSYSIHIPGDWVRPVSNKWIGQRYKSDAAETRRLSRNIKKNSCTVVCKYLSAHNISQKQLQSDNIKASENKLNKALLFQVNKPMIIEIGKCLLLSLLALLFISVALGDVDGIGISVNNNNNLNVL